MVIEQTPGLYCWRVQVTDPNNWEKHDQVNTWLKERFHDCLYVLAYTNVVYFKHREDAMMFAVAWA